jgi:hypothetical protein
LSPIQDDNFDEISIEVANKYSTGNKLNRSSSVAKSTVLTKYMSMAKDNTKNNTKYKFVNLESSCNSSLSRTKSASRHSYISSKQNNISNIVFHRSASKAQEFRESMKRSKSGNRMSIERSINDQPSTIRQLKQKISLNRLNSEKSFSLHTTDKSPFRQSKTHPFAQSVRNLKIPNVSKVENRIKAFGPKRTFKDASPKRNYKLKLDLERIYDENQYTQADMHQSQGDSDFNSTMLLKAQFRQINQELNLQNHYDNVESTTDM